MSSEDVPSTSLFTTFKNKIQYLIAKKVSDPKADEYAKIQADKAAQAAAVKKREDEAKAKASQDAVTQAASNVAAADLAARSKFKPKELMSEVAKGILAGFMSLVLLCFILYGGHLASNAAIGYNVPFRILSFIYGVIFSIWVVPKALYDVYWKGKTLPYYTFFPLSTHIPRGDLEKIFIGGFCYTEDEASGAARAAVINLYTDAFSKSVAAAGAAAVTVVAAVIAQILKSL